MAEEFIPEGFELVDKEQQKQKEVIPGFEVVEKQEVAVGNAAPVAAEEISGALESNSPESSLESNTDDNEKPKKKKKIKNKYFAGEDSEGKLVLFSNKYEYKDWVDKNKEKKRSDIKVVDSINVDSDLDKDISTIDIDEMLVDETTANIIKNVFPSPLNTKSVSGLNDQDKKVYQNYLKTGKINLNLLSKETLKEHKKTKTNTYDVVRYDKVQLPVDFRSNEDLYEDKEEVKINIPGEDPISYSREKTKEYYVPVYEDSEGNQVVGDVKIDSIDFGKDIATDNNLALNYLKGVYDNDLIKKEKIRTRLNKRYADDFPEGDIDKYELKSDTGLAELNIEKETLDKLETKLASLNALKQQEKDPKKLEKIDKDIFNVVKEIDEEKSVIKALEDEVKLESEFIIGVTVEDKKIIQADPAYYTPQIEEAKAKIAGKEEEIKAIPATDVEAIKIANDELFNLRGEESYLEIKQIESLQALDEYKKLSPFISERLKDIDASIEVLEERISTGEGDEQDEIKLAKLQKEKESLGGVGGINNIFAGNIVRNKQTGEFEVKVTTRNKVNKLRSLFSDLGVKGAITQVNDKETSRQGIVKMKPSTVATNINNNFLNYSIGADVDGDEVIAYKNPIMYTEGDEAGKVDVIKTAENNGIKYKDVVAFQTNYNKSKTLLRKINMKEAAAIMLDGNNFSKKIEVGKMFGGGDSDIEDIENFANWVDKNKSEFKTSSNISYYQNKFKDPKQERRYKENVTSLENKSNKIKGQIRKNNKLISQVQHYSDVVRESVDRMNELSDKLKEDIEGEYGTNSYQDYINQELKDLAEYTERKILNDPKNSERYIREFEDQKNYLKKEFDGYNKEKRKIIKKFNKDYTEEANYYTESVEKLDLYSDKQDVLVKSIQSNLDNISMLVAVNQQFDYINKTRTELAGKVYENNEGVGNTFLAISKTFTDQFATITEGKAQLLADVADGFNWLGYKFNLQSQGEYNHYKDQIEADRRSFHYQATAAAEVMRPPGIDDNFYNKWSESTFGGTIQALTQMVASSFGAPVTGLGGGFFFSSLADNKQKMRQLKDSFINGYIENNPGASKKEAQKEFNRRVPKNMQVGYAYTQAAVEGVLSHISGKIMKGGGKYTSALVSKITNSVLSKMAGNVTARDIQIAVYKTLGNAVSKMVSNGTRLTIVGLEEMLEETTQMGIAGGIDSWFGGQTGLNFEGFNIFDKIRKGDKDLVHMAKISFLSGMAGGSINVLANNTSLLTETEENLNLQQRRELDNFYYTLAEQSSSADNLKSEIGKLEEKYEANEISEEMLNEGKRELQENYSLYSDIMQNENINGRTIINVATLTKQKQKLEKKVNNIKNQAAAANLKDKIKAIDEQIETLVKDPNNRRLITSKEVIESQLNTVIDIKNEKGANIEGNGEVIVFNKDNVEEVAKNYNVPVEALMDENGEFMSEGSYIPEQGVVLMSEEASKGVEEHEGTHIYFDQSLNKEENADVVFALAESITNKIKEQNPKVAKQLEKQLQKYVDDPTYSAKDVAEEALTYYAQFKKRGVFDTDKSFSRQLIDYIQKLFRNMGFTNMVIDENNIDKIIDDYVENLQSGGLSKKQKKILKGDIKFSEETKERGRKLKEEGMFEPTPVLDINQKEQVEITPQEQSKQRAAKPLNVDTKSMSNTFDQNISEELVTNEDFKNSEAAIDAYTAIDSNPQFNSYINQLINRDSNLQGLDSDVKQEVNRKIKENLQLRALNNFKPVVDGNRRSLFSYLYGKADQRGLGGIAQKALLDVKKEYATRADAGARSTDVTDSEGRSFDIADTSTDIIEDVDRGVAEAPRSTFRRNIVRGNEKGLTPKEIKSFKEVTQPIVDKLPSVDDKKYRTKVDQVSGKELKSWVKENILKGQDYKTFIKDNYNNIRDLDLKYLIELDKGLMKQGKERMFTKPNRRLTTQADIRKYRDSGRAFVENEAQGVMLYDILDPGADAVVDFYTNQTPQNVSNRKGKFMEAIGKKMFKDVLPETRAQRGDTDQVKATSARKTQVQPTLKFAKPIEKDIVDSGVDQMIYEDYISDQKFWSKFSEDVGGKNYNFNDPKQLKEWKQKEFPKLVKIFPKDFILNSGAFYGYRGFPFRDNNPTKISKQGKLQPEHRKAFEKYLNENFNDSDYGPPIKNLDIALEKIGQKSKKFNSYFGSEQNIKNNKIKEEVLKEIFLRIQNADGNIIPAAVGMLRTTPAEQAHFMRKIAPVTFRQLGIEKLSSGQITEEHALGASLVAKQSLLLASDNVVDDNFTGITRNYFQGPISKVNDDKVNAKELGMKEGPQKEDLYRVLIGDISGWIRYAKTPGFNLNTIQILDNKGNKILLTDFYNVGVDNKYKNMPNVIAQQNALIVDQIANGLDAKTANQRIREYVDNLAVEQNKANKSNYAEMKQSKVLNVDEEMDMETLLSKAASIDEALRLANSLDQPVKKIRVFDFDDTLATSNNIVIATSPDGKSRNLNAEQFAKEGLELKEQGWTMDFSDFNKVTDGGRGPLFDIAKKIDEARGNEDLFVLTARAPQSADAIYEFLKAEGLEFKRSNIIGLGNSTGEAKANWIIDKAAEGYNDFYFADDAYQNVKAVRDALGVIDVKSKVQQARIKESKKLDIQFNKLLEETTGVEFFKEYSPAKAKTIGASKGKFKFFIPHSAEDFLGLIYPTLGKGKLGDRQMAWYKKHLIDPYTKAQESLSAARLNLMNDFKQLKKSLNVPKDLRKKNSTGMTNEQAVRVYLFQSMGYEVPGLSKTDLKELQSVVEKDPKLKTFADQILSITKGDGYSKPRSEWLTGTITTDLIDLINTEKRSKYLADWQENVDAIYSKENLNKLEAIYGSKYREALEGILKRMKSGRNRLDTGNRLSNKVLDYINGSIGTIMFFNTRSAVLQTISSINFINWNFNNPIKAGAAMANQPQYWKDFVKLMNSDYLKDRRNGLKLNISESEIADAAATSKNKAKAAINYILQKGYLPTQYADSFAIASGGATFYRNRIKDLMKNNGMTEAEAEAQALIEWRQVAEESQQSSDPSRISAQQSSDLGRIILAFANTPMQYARIQKRAIQDLINGRGDAKTHVSKIIYYGFVQNIIFNALQQAVFALGFGDDDEEEDSKKQKKYMDTANGMLDSLLRGLGIAGQAVSVGKNFLMDIYERSGRDRPEYVDAVWKLTQFSPPISSKISKLKQAAWHFDSKKRRQVIFDKGFALDNPAYEAFAKVVSATTNIPIDRLFYKMKNIEGALNEDNDLWQRIAMLAGWPEWQLKDKEKEPEATPEQKEKAKASKAIANYKAAKGSTDYDTLKKLTAAQQIKMLKGLGYGEYTIKNAKSEKAKIDLIIHKNSGGKIKVDKKAEDTAKYKALNKAEQVAKLDSLGLSDAEIKALKYEQDRVDKLLELMK